MQIIVSCDWKMNRNHVISPFGERTGRGSLLIDAGKAGVLLKINSTENTLQGINHTV